MSAQRARQRIQERKDKERKRNIRNGAIAFGVIAVFTINLMRGGEFSEPLAPEDVIAMGERVYQETCAACHGEYLEGHAAVLEAPALNGSEHSWHHADGQIQTLINEGGVLMPALAEQVSDDEIIAVIRYIQSNWAVDQLAFQQDVSVNNPMQ